MESDKHYLPPWNLPNTFLLLHVSSLLFMFCCCCFLFFLSVIEIVFSTEKSLRLKGIMVKSQGSYENAPTQSSWALRWEPETLGQTLESDTVGITVWKTYKEKWTYPNIAEQFKDTTLWKYQMIKNWKNSAGCEWGDSDETQSRLLFSDNHHPTTTTPEILEQRMANIRMPNSHEGLRRRAFFVGSTAEILIQWHWTGVQVVLDIWGCSLRAKHFTHTDFKGNRIDESL